MEPSDLSSPSITCVVLAGGQALRFRGADKGLISIAGRPLIKRVLESVALQVEQVLIVANRNQRIYSAYGHRVIPDSLPGYQGPLAGIATGLAEIDTDLALFVPVDAARLPPDLVASLLRIHQTHGQVPCFVHAASGPMPVCCLLRKSEYLHINQALDKGERSVLAWLRSRLAIEVDFSDWPAQFWSLNEPTERAALEKALRR